MREIDRSRFAFSVRWYGALLPKAPLGKLCQATSTRRWQAVHPRALLVGPPSVGRPACIVLRLQYPAPPYCNRGRHCRACTRARITSRVRGPTLTLGVARVQCAPKCSACANDPSQCERAMPHLRAVTPVKYMFQSLSSLKSCTGNEHQRTADDQGKRRGPS